MRGPAPAPVAEVAAAAAAQKPVLLASLRLETVPQETVLPAAKVQLAAVPFELVPFPDQMLPAVAAAATTLLLPVLPAAANQVVLAAATAQDLLGHQRRTVDKTAAIVRSQSFFKLGFK